MEPKEVLYRCPECRRRSGHKMDCGRRGDSAPHVVKSLAWWAEHEHVPAPDYYDEAKRLGYPIQSLASPVPKHWHDDIKIKFREARRG